MKRAKAARLPWCGLCDETARTVDLPNGTVGRCPRCHAALQPGGRLRPDRSKTRRPLGSTSPTCLACGQRVLKNHTCHASSLRRDATTERKPS